MLATNAEVVSEFFHTLARYFHETRDRLNFLSVHSCSENLPLMSCIMYVRVELSTKTYAVVLNFYHWCKTPSSALSKKISATTPNFLHVFGIAPSDLQQLLCFVQLKTLATSARYSTFKDPDPVTLKPGLGVTQGHRKLCHSMRHPYDFLLTFHSNYRSISHYFRDKWQYPLKIAYFPTPMY